MYRYLEYLRMGLIEPATFKTLECRKRSSNLELSVLKDLENVHSSGVKSLDADNESGSFLLSGCVDGSIYIHDLRNLTGSPCYTSKAIYKIERGHLHAHNYSVETVQWYPFDHGLFTTSGMGKVLKVWDTSNMKPVESIKYYGRIFQHHISPVPMKTNCLIAVATTVNQVILSDMRTGSNIHELRGHTSSILCCRWSPTQEFLLATGSADNKIIFWDVRSPKSCLMQLDQHNGKEVSKNQEQTAHNGFVNGLCFTRNGHRLLSLGKDCRLRLWNVCLGKNEMVNYGHIPNKTKKSVQIDVSENVNNGFVYIPSKGNVLMFNIDTGTKVKTMYGHCNVVNCCYYDCLSVQLYTGGNDHSILCWSYESEIGVFEEVKTSCTTCNGHKAQSLVTGDTWSSDDDSH